MGPDAGTFQGRLLFAKSGPFLLAFSMEEAVAVVAVHIVERAPQRPGVALGMIYARREAMPLLSLRAKLGLPAAKRPSKALVAQCFGVSIALAIDEAAHVSQPGAHRILPLPGSLSLLRPGALMGFVKAEGHGGLLISIAGLFPEAELACVSETLLGA